MIKQTRQRNAAAQHVDRLGRLLRARNGHAQSGRKHVRVARALFVLELRARRAQRRRPVAEDAATNLIQPITEPLCGGLGTGVFGKAGGEFFSRLLRIRHVVDFVRREQQTDLEFQERGNQDEELAGALQIDLALLLDLREVPQANVGDGDLAEIDDVAQHKRQQQVKRPAEGLEIKIELQCGGRGHSPQR